MTNKKKEFLRKGLSSELFFEAFLMPSSGYKLAQIIQDTKSPQTKSVYRVLNKLVSEGYLIHEDEKYYHNPSKLVEELVPYLKLQNVSINSKEKKILKKLLTNTRFFIYLILFTTESKKSSKHKLRKDALYEISNLLGMYVAIVHHGMKTSSTKPYKTNMSFEKINERLSDFTQMTLSKIAKNMKGSKSDKKLQIKQNDVIYKFLQSFILLMFGFDKIPKEYVEKFASLWDQYDGFKIGLNIGKIDLKSVNFTD